MKYVLDLFTPPQKQRSTRPYLLFAAFTLACGGAYLLYIVIFRSPFYLVSPLLRITTAIIGWIIIFALVRLAPYIFSLKSLRSLEAEIEMRKRAESDLQVKNLLVEESKQLFKNVFDYSAVGVALV